MNICNKILSDLSQDLCNNNSFDKKEYIIKIRCKYITIIIILVWLINSR